jgi:HPt (histidine-containing phosphotransfer) domain-containing protein
MADALTIARARRDRVVDAGVRTIDLVHLARMTLGDPSLEREVLQLFVRQATMLLERMNAAPAPAIGTFAHTLKGSAQGLGAWQVAAAAEAVESAAREHCSDLAATLMALSSAVAEAKSSIDDLLRDH